MKPAILVVEDESTILSMLKVVLESNGFDVTTADSAGSALDALAAKSFDVVLTDIKMETDYAGLEVARAAHAQSYSPAIVILTAFPLPPQQWREAGAHAMLAKPATTADILSAIERLLKLRGSAHKKPQRQ